MTATTNPIVAFGRRWQVRLTKLATVESILAALISAMWAFFGFLWAWPVLLVVLIVAAVLHITAAEHGNHALLWMASAFVMMCMLVAAVSNAVVGLATLAPMPLLFGTLTVLAHNELLRLHIARRRNAALTEDLYVGSAIGMGILALVSVVGVALAQAAEGEGGRSWLWMVGATALLLVTASAITFVPKRITPRGTNHRWQPGERIPPQPLGPLDIDEERRR